MMFYLGLVVGFSVAFMVFAVFSSGERHLSAQTVKAPRL